MQAVREAKGQIWGYTGALRCSEHKVPERGLAQAQAGLPLETIPT
jgi:hypothetical protein